MPRPPVGPVASAAPPPRAAAPVVQLLAGAWLGAPLVVAAAQPPGLGTVAGLADWAAVALDRCFTF